MAASRDFSKQISLIAAENAPAKLKNWMENARTSGADEVYKAAFRRLCELSGRDYEEVLDREFQEIMTALETALTEARGRTTRLNRTRQKLERVGVKRLLADLAMKATPSEGFLHLVNFGMADMSAEALIIRHSEMFEAEVVAAARDRLNEYGIPHSVA